MSPSDCASGETCFAGVCAVTEDPPGSVVLPVAGTIDLDFTKDVLPDGVSFSRASAAMSQADDYVLTSVATDVPRLERDPTFGQSRGVLIEPATQNLCLYSGAIDNSGRWWSARVAREANAALAPDATMTGTRLTPSEAENYHSVGQSLRLTAGADYTYSIFVKAGELEQIFVGLTSTGSYPNQQLNLLDGTLSQSKTQDTVKDAGVLTAGDGWYRAWIVFESDSGSVDTNIMVDLGFMAPDAGRGLYVWGGQLEPGDTPTSYVPTANATANRDSDALMLSALTTIDVGNDYTLLVVESVDVVTDALAVGLSVQIDDDNELFIGRRSRGDGVVLLERNGSTALELGAGEAWRADEVHALAFTKQGENIAFADNGAVTTAIFGSFSSPTFATSARVGQRMQVATAPTRVYRVVAWQQAFDTTTLATMTRP